jgi:hypothetical protein
MKIVSKKNMLALLTGTLLFAGAMNPYIVQAAAGDASSGQNPPVQQRLAAHPPQINPEKAAQNIAEIFSVSKEEVLAYQTAHPGDFRDIFHGALLAKTSGKNFQDIMSMKTNKNTWKDVEGTLGITPEQLKDTQYDLISTHLEKKLHISKDTSRTLLKQGYHPDDIAAAGVLAKESNKSITDLLAMRKINNSWQDIAKTLGIAEKTFFSDMKDAFFPIGGMPDGMHGKHFSHPCPPPQDGQPGDLPAPPESSENTNVATPGSGE